MTDQGFGEVCPLPGSGLVAHVGGLLLVCDADSDTTADLIAALRETVAAGDDGRALARRVAQLLARAMMGEPVACAVAGPAAGGVAVLVSGAASAVVGGGDGEVHLAGRDALTWTDRLVPGPASRVELLLPGAGSPHPLARLDAGVVVGGGLRTGELGAAPTRVEAPAAARNDAPQAAPMAPYPMGEAAPDYYQEPARPEPAARPEPIWQESTQHHPAPPPFGMSQSEVLPARHDSQPPYPSPADSLPPLPAPSGPDLGSPSGPIPIGAPVGADAEEHWADGGQDAHGDGRFPDSQPFPDSPPFGDQPPFADQQPYAESQMEPAPAAEGPASDGPMQPGPGPLVYGVDCKNDHFNTPHAPYCAVCNVPLVQSTLVPYQGPRPPLGLLVLDDGTSLRLDSDYLLGRDPDRAPEVAGGTAKPAKVTSPDGSVSRRHLRVALDNWDVNLVDLGSVNGTQIQPPGDPNFYDIPPNEAITILPGTIVRIGVSRTMRYDGHRDW
ncbi:FHA domain-containing protein [Sinosporangium siamense]|uniref:FHA domain-containing protein n=1 Tax=Sinosporangium siamense TaxID=1367973 RepID=A0A919RL04_9ACTN|nr:FHA domain-containing protein [Sinosporangium siamense]GII93864.1 hypothetical protein Ssi02_40950 [Sinosporangium siamense]